MKSILTIVFLLLSVGVFSQGRNHNWLIGYNSGLDTNVISNNAIVSIDTNSITVTPTNFKMAFRAAQGNISNSNGDLLMVSNGCWIADASLDTMQNGGGLNPNTFTNDWCDNVSGIPFPHSNIIIPFPADSNKFILFHQTGSYTVPNSKSLALYYSVIDITLNGGLGAVISGQKNLIAIQDTLNPMLAACKHANGRDWWLFAFEDDTDLIYKVWISPSGISSVTTQSITGIPNYYGMGQANFSPDGTKFAYHHRDFGPNGVPVYHTIRLYDFDRCNGQISNGTIISLTDSISGHGMAFSSNSQFIYFSLFNKIYQINTDTTNIQASLQLVATNDGYCFPYNFTCTDFWLLYLAANGKIYISSGSSVVDMHVIENPDNPGIACDVQQHSLHLPCYSTRGNVYHPNYYLGCDTTSNCPCLITEVNETASHNFKFSVSPNPTTSNSITIKYSLEQNTPGLIKIFNTQGKVVYSYPLPPWSSIQNLTLPNLSRGIYLMRLECGDRSKVVKFVKY